MRILNNRCRFEIAWRRIISVAPVIAVVVFITLTARLYSCGMDYWKAFTTKWDRCPTSISNWESYYKIELSPAIEAQFPLYKLYLTAELYTKELYRRKNFSFDNREILNGIPVLFIPGNCGFHEQGRSINSILVHMIEHRGYSEKHLFDYFTIDFNEESLALSGHYLFRAKVRIFFW